MGFKQDTPRNFISQATIEVSDQRRIRFRKFIHEAAQSEVFSWARYAATRLEQFDLAQNADAECFASGIKL